MKYNFLDLFAGIGGFALGAKWAGMEFDGHWFSEIDPYASQVYARHNPEAVALGNIREIDFMDTSELTGLQSPWIIAGGFPCQDVSNAGPKKGIKGSRSGLWSEMFRIIGDIRPRFVIIENVRALINRGLEAVLCDLASIRYDAEWADLQARDFGADHERARIICVAYPYSEHSEGLPRVGDQQNRAAKIFGNGATQRHAIRIQAAVAAAGGDDGVSRELYENRARGIGLSIFPPIADFIFRRIQELDMEAMNESD